MLEKESMKKWHLLGRYWCLLTFEGQGNGYNETNVIESNYGFISGKPFMSSITPTSCLRL